MATIILVIAPAFGVLASTGPLTAKEIMLMLRLGYSNETVLRELSARHFGDIFGSEVEQQLERVGANSSLIEALRNGVYQASASQMAAAKAKPDVAETGTAGQAHEEAVQAKPAPATLPADAIYSHLKGDLVCSHQGSVIPFDDEGLEHKKLYLLFFSANWSVPGRKFTPQLVEYYNRVAPQHPEFEVIFFSADHSQFGMETYMAQSSMPWPAIGYDKLGGKAGDFRQNLAGVPGLVLVDAAGNILSRSSGGQDESSLGKVLADLDQIFARSTDSDRARPR